MKVNQRFKGELVLKRLSKSPPPYLNYPHNGLLILYPPSLQFTLFISFLCLLSTSQSCVVLYSYYSVPSYLHIKSDCFPLSLTFPGIYPALHPCPSYFLKPTALCRYICPDLHHHHPLICLFSFASLPLSTHP